MCKCAKSWCDLDLTFDLTVVIFNLGSAKVGSPAIIETYFSYNKDIWIAVAHYCIHRMHQVDTLI